MTAPRSIADRIRDILEAAANIERFVQGMDLGSFSNDEKTVYAVTRGIEIIGEAVKGVPEKVRSEHPGIPWKEMAGMRDKVIHDYPGVDVLVLWGVATEELPPLRPSLQEVLDGLAKNRRVAKGEID